MTYRVLSHNGPLCPRCKRPTHVREHAWITEKQLSQPLYYRRWYVCMNADCVTKQIMPKEFIVYNNQAAKVERTYAPEPALPFEGGDQSGTPPWEDEPAVAETSAPSLAPKAPNGETKGATRPSESDLAAGMLALPI